MDEPLTWSVVANVSRDAYTPQRGKAKRPGTRHFVPGAKVWVMPVVWGDGGDQRYVVGTRRGTGGRHLIRLVLNTDRLVNFSVKPVHSPAVYAAMGQPHYADVAPTLYLDREHAQHSADAWKWDRTRRPHLGLWEFDSGMHNADEECAFCDGRDAAQAGEEAINPYEVPIAENEGSVDWWSTDHGLWRAGWLTEKDIVNPNRLDDLALRLLGFARNRARRRAELLAEAVAGRTLAELQADGYGRDRLRFVRGDRRPRRLDGIVQAWLDDDDRVVRTQSG
ncbi:hypothetical protein [Paractinoplanes lichenicola]|uniref:Uncharacterized protein n=1 Tax=Paractinoplanes lichenicola TaxID=2802976 RepID=A0ABS1VMA6_9ACTN|nr:hypothetical protein [Actinoplanes lichenicola]MBL7254892.1 hypothetical protein [Actinoplanes lichenicola]